VRDELGRDQLDAGASEAFALADYQSRMSTSPAGRTDRQGCALLRSLPRCERVLDEEGKREFGPGSSAFGELVANRPRRQLVQTYYHFLDDARAPDYARYRRYPSQPGYDPVELFLDPSQPFGQGTYCMEARAEKTRVFSLSHDVMLSGCDAGQGLARPADGTIR